MNEIPHEWEIKSYWQRFTRGTIGGLQIGSGDMALKNGLFTVNPKTIGRWTLVELGLFWRSYALALNPNLLAEWRKVDTSVWGYAPTDLEGKKARQIQKLMRLGESPNPHEAAAAIKKAAELRATVEETMSVQVISPIPGPRMTNTDAAAYIGKTLRYLGLHVGWLPAMTLSGRGVKLMLGYGEAEDLAYGAEVVAYLLKAEAKAWRTRAGTPDRESFRGGFFRGVLNAVHEQSVKEAVRNGGDGSNLCSKAEAAQAFANRLNPHWRESRGRAHRDGASQAQGRDVGHGTGINLFANRDE